MLLVENFMCLDISKENYLFVLSSWTFYCVCGRLIILQMLGYMDHNFLISYQIHSYKKVRHVPRLLTMLRITSKNSSIYSADCEQQKAWKSLKWWLVGLLFFSFSFHILIIFKAFFCTLMYIKRNSNE